ncbi:MAG: type II toxin-antitoxin system RelE/ParE family toxin [Reyranella sp.]|nr:type II toxin-antitoxin system RelE/ParE family toxin [Reyranella sp.]MDP3160253.1 type II toxin-antitoxin system RelE/ParE family toxin [Reyranella sp.]
MTLAIASFRHKGLQELFVSGRSGKIGSTYQKPAILILDHLNAAIDLADLRNVRKLHTLKGREAGRHSMWVSGNYRITFGWRDGRAVDVDFEDYH